MLLLLAASWAIIAAVAMKAYQMKGIAEDAMRALSLLPLPNKHHQVAYLYCPMSEEPEKTVIEDEKEDE